MVHVGYWGQHGQCYGEDCSHGTHCLVLTELGCYCGHTHLTAPYPGPLQPEVKARMDEVSNVFQIHYHSGWAYMAGYAQHLLQLQHDT
jgi:hypothetical protein